MAHPILNKLLAKFAPTGQYPLGMSSSGLNSRITQQVDLGSQMVWTPYKLSEQSEEQPAAKPNNDAPELMFDASTIKAIAESRPNTMTLRQATTCRDNAADDYRMTSRPRGYCLIVNNVDFEHDLFPTRRGSDQDAFRFDRLFRELGFETVMSRNLTADQMRARFRELAAACRQEHDALFVFILSHGSEYGFYGVDGLEVDLDGEVIPCFDNRNCKAMIGKPKVFIIQACRGDEIDSGGDTTDAMVTLPSAGESKAATTAFQRHDRVPTSWLPSQKPNDVCESQKHPIRTDMLLVFSCLAGFVSVRNETAGSWLGVALAYFIMTHAHERDLLKILNLVSSDITQRVSSQGHFQSVELKLYGWKKNLFFNPGIYRN